jgi:hypothetical protein
MTNRSSALAKRHLPAQPSPESLVLRGAPQPAPRNDVDRRVGPAPAVLVTRGGPLIPASLRLDMIRDAAFFRAEARNFAPGQEIEDWLAAEQDVDELIQRRYGR